MFGSKSVTVVPAFFAENKDGHKLPFVVSVKFWSADGICRLTPAVEKSIDRALQISGAQGVAIANVEASTPWKVTNRKIELAMAVKGAMALFQCESGEVAEQLQRDISEHYVLSLMKEPLNAEPSGDFSES